jgi:polysaccharide export outer membrane protein
MSFNLDVVRPNAGWGSLLALLGAAGGLAGCSNNLVTAAGPSTAQVLRAQGGTTAQGIRIIPLTPQVARGVTAAQRRGSFAAAFGEVAAAGMVVDVGDTVEVVIWEAPPAALFGTPGVPSPAAARLNAVETARPTTLPEQMVDSDGRITVPFAGVIAVAGRAPRDIARDIERRLAGKAHKPQTVVRIVRNSTAAVTVVGQVNRSTRLPLTVRGERLLDAIAEAGGVTQQVDKITVQVTRGNRVEAMPLSAVIANPSENIVLQLGDVVTALYQPLSFTVLGATGRNEEIPIEATGVTLSQALGRIGGLQDQRADARGVFIFRFEDPQALAPDGTGTAAVTADGRVPVIYRVDLRDPTSFFTAQNFPIRDKDIIYVSNAPLADVQKFVNIISSTIFPIATIGNVVR